MQQRQFFPVYLFAGLLAAFLSVCSTANLSAADMQYPLAVVAADKGPIYVADRNLPGIWKITDGKAEVFFQGSKKFRTPLNAVRCLAIDKQGKLLAGDSSTREVYRFDEPGKPQPLTKGGIGIPMAIAVDEQGDLFVADIEVQRIWKVPAKGGEPKEFAQIAAVRGLAFDKEGNLWVVSALAKNQLLRLSPDGKVTVILKERVFKMPHHIVFDADGAAYIADNYSGAIWKVPTGGKPKKWVSGKPLLKPVGVGRQGDNILIADPHAKTIFSADKEGKVTVITGPAAK